MSLFFNLRNLSYLIEMGHENTKNLKSIYKTEDFRNLNPYMQTPWDWHHYVW